MYHIHLSFHFRNYIRKIGANNKLNYSQKEFHVFSESSSNIYCSYRYIAKFLVNTILKIGTSYILMLQVLSKYHIYLISSFIMKIFFFQSRK